MGSPKVSVNIKGSNFSLYADILPAVLSAVLTWLLDKIICVE